MIYNASCTKITRKIGGYAYMEFNGNRGGRPSGPAAPSTGNARPDNTQSTSTNGSGASSSSSGPSFGSTAPHSSGKSSLLSMRTASVALLFAVTALVVTLLVFLAVGSPRSEANFIEEDKYQAVFLNGGQVYFGQVTDLNNKYMRVVDIYYLRVNQQVQPADDGELAAPAADDISLVKLGCELHGPKDEMLINREQIIFWENLKDDGQVSEAIAEFKAENPDGQDCEVPEAAGTPQQQVPAPDPDGFAAPANEEDEE